MSVGLYKNYNSRELRSETVNLIGFGTGAYIRTTDNNDNDNLRYLMYALNQSTKKFKKYIKMSSSRIFLKWCVKGK